MKLSFVVTTHGAMNTSSSSVEYAVMYASAWMRVPRADGRVVLDQRAAAEDAVVAERRRARGCTTGRRRCSARRSSSRRRRSRRSRRSCRRRSRAGGSGSRFAVERGAERRLLADDGVLEHAHAVAEHRARVDGRGRVDLSGTERLRQHLERAHDARAVARDLRRGRRRRSISSRKCVHSSRSGSSVEIFGM